MLKVRGLRTSNKEEGFGRVWMGLKDGPHRDGWRRHEGSDFSEASWFKSPSVCLRGQS